MEVLLFNLVCRKINSDGVIEFHKSQQTTPGELKEKYCAIVVKLIFIWILSLKVRFYRVVKFWLWKPSEASITLTFISYPKKNIFPAEIFTRFCLLFHKKNRWDSNKKDSHEIAFLLCFLVHVVKHSNLFIFSYGVAAYFFTRWW